MKRFWWLICLGVANGLAHAQTAPGACGEPLALEAPPGSTLRYAFQPPSGTAAPVTLLLLPGGHGFLDLDAKGCARKLKGNSLVRSLPIFQAAGFGTALLDAPVGFQGEDGLGGYRIDPHHAQDIGRVIVDLRARTGGAVWVLGTSRGAISAVNATSRLSGEAAPDGVVLSSALMAGQPGARKSWVAHSVFDLPLENIRQPVLVLGHAADTCVRSPASLMDRITARTQGVREQLVTVTGGPGGAQLSSVDACEGRSPHGFVEQEAEVAAGIARFVRGGRY
ncbi:MAG: alpha/beta hydrolase [Hydrogenophaga sp.]|uniref:alpha/beta hydrolase n=1 Tax=Hydrogenophaga sp. TaxID=1904254 RepID=UPI003D0A9D6A